MKRYCILVETYGYSARFLVYAKDVRKAKLRAKYLATKDILSRMFVSEVV